MFTIFVLGNLLVALMLASAFGFLNRPSSSVLLSTVFALILFSSVFLESYDGLQQCESPVSSDLRDPGRCGVLHGL